jgi:hypothetical protein
MIDVRKGVEVEGDASTFLVLLGIEVASTCTLTHCHLIVINCKNC